MFCVQCNMEFHHHFIRVVTTWFSKLNYTVPYSTLIVVADFIRKLGIHLVCQQEAIVQCLVIVKEEKWLLSLMPLSLTPWLMIYTTIIIWTILWLGTGHRTIAAPDMYLIIFSGEAMHSPALLPLPSKDSKKFLLAFNWDVGRVCRWNGYPVIRSKV